VNVRGTLSLVAALALVAIAPAAAQARTTPLVFGVSDNAGLFSEDTGEQFFSTLRRANMTENAMVVTWRAGQLAPDAIQKAFLDRSIATAQKKGVKIVLVVYPAVPREHDAEQFCAFMKALAVTYEYLDEWGVGNEVNKADFWFPPSPDSYLPVLARCFDLLEAEGETVIGFEFSPRKTPSSPSPVQYLKEARAVFLAMNRNRPLMHLLGYHPHPNLRADLQDVSPTKRAPWPDTGPADVDRLKQAVEDAFHGTAQPTFSGGLQAKLRELGWQVATDGRALYIGDENVKVVDEETQAQYYVQMIERLACDPQIAELLLFLLIDEKERGGRNLANELVSGGWQSGLVRADWTERPSFAAVAGAISRTGGMCQGAETVWRPATGAVGAAADFSDAKRIHPRKGTYFAVILKMAEQGLYRAGLFSLGRRPAVNRGAIERALERGGAARRFLVEGNLLADRGRLVRFPKRRLPPGWYVYAAELRAWANEERTSFFISKPFQVR
jgi:hypothetical protein